MTNSNAQQHTASGRHFWIYLVCAAFVILLCGVLYLVEQHVLETREAYLAQVQETREKDVFPNGVFVDHVPIGNMSYEQAQSTLLEAINNRRTQMAVTVRYHSEGYLIRLREDMLSHDLDEILDRAMALGDELDTEAYADYIQQLPYYPVYLETTLKIDPSGLEEEVRALAQSLTTAPANANLLSFDMTKPEFERFTYQKETIGYSIDADWLWREVKKEFLYRQDGEVEVVAHVLEPDVLLSDLQRANGIAASFTTNFTANEAQLENLRKLCGEISGTILPGQETFSWNEMIGECTQEEGYRTDGTVDAVANLTATTLMNAALLTGFDITERSPNLQTQSYTERGREVQVNKDQNFSFTNTADEYAILVCYVDADGAALTAEIYTMPAEDAGMYTIETAVEEVIAFPEAIQYVASTKLEPGQTFATPGQDGEVCVTYRVLSRDGMEIEREEVFRAEYAATPARVYYCAQDEVPMP